MSLKDYLDCVTEVKRPCLHVGGPFLGPGLTEKESELHTSLPVIAVGAVKWVCFFLKNCFYFDLLMEVRILAGGGSLLPSCGFEGSNSSITFGRKPLPTEPSCHTPPLHSFLFILTYV